MTNKASMAAGTPKHSGRRAAAPANGSDHYAKPTLRPAWQLALPGIREGGPLRPLMAASTPRHPGRRAAAPANGCDHYAKANVKASVAAGTPRHPGRRAAAPANGCDHYAKANVKASVAAGTPKHPGRRAAAPANGCDHYARLIANVKASVAAGTPKHPGRRAAAPANGSWHSPSTQAVRLYWRISTRVAVVNKQPLCTKHSVSGSSLPMTAGKGCCKPNNIRCRPPGCKVTVCPAGTSRPSI